MSGGGMKPETIVRKRLERAELGRDACRMKRCGHSYRKIGEQLGCSHEQAHVLVQEGINAYLNEAKQESKEWLDAIIAEHIKIAQEAWIQWVHLLEREGALKVLAAVQSAAEDEMPFEQRAGVAENLEDFGLCLGPSFKWRARGDKRQVGVLALACL